MRGCLGGLGFLSDENPIGKKVDIMNGAVPSVCIMSGIHSCSSGENIGEQCLMFLFINCNVLADYVESNILSPCRVNLVLQERMELQVPW